MRIEYGRAAYIPNVGDEMMDLIDRNVSYVASREGITIVCFEEIASWGDMEPEDRIELSENRKKLKSFMREVYDNLRGEVGDVFFFA